MKSSLKKQAERFLREQKNYKRWLAVFLCLAVVVTIGTTAALKYRGIAVTGDDPATEAMYMEQTEGNTEEIPEGMRRHVHTEECYEMQPVLICEEGRAEAANSGAAGEVTAPETSAQGHVHTDACYTVTGGIETLTCTKEEHTHNGGCYETNTVTEEVTDEEGNVTGTVEKEEKVLTCSKEEHTHGASCYTVEGGERTLTCTILEGAEAAAPAAASTESAAPAAEAESTAQAPAEAADAEATGETVSGHVHTDACYELQPVLICGKEEGELELDVSGNDLVFIAGEQTAETENYIVTVSYTEKAGFQEGTELRVVEYAKDSEDYVNYCGELGYQPDGLLDIGFFMGSSEVEPREEVTVKVTDKNAKEAERYEIVHFADGGAKEVENKTTQTGTGIETEFSVDSFSIFSFKLLNIFTVNRLADDNADNNVAEVAPAGKLVHEKKVEPASADSEGINIYDLTLNVKGAVGSSEDKAKLDILFVLDTSGSMAKNLNNNETGGTSRRKEANDAISGLVDDLSKDSNLDVKYKLITFATTADASNAGNWMDGTALKRMLPSGSTGGTNYEDALIKAGAAVSTEKRREDAKSIVIFMTDGAPTYYNNGTDRWGNINVGGEGNSTDKTTVEHAVESAKNVNCDYFYAIGFGPEMIKNGEIGSSGYTAKEILERIAGIKPTAQDGEGVTATGRDVSTRNDLSVYFDGFLESLKAIKAKKVSFTDTLTQEVDIVNPDGTKVDAASDKNWVVSITDKDGNDITDSEQAEANMRVAYAAETKTLNVTFNPSYILKEDYTYSVTTKIKPNELAEAKFREHYSYPDTGDANTGSKSSNQAGIFCNVEDSAKVSYSYMVNDQEIPVDQNDPELKYPRPVVQFGVTPQRPPIIEQEMTHDKYIKKVTGQNDVYDLTLDLTGRIGSSVKPAYYDVLFVVDISGSMKDNSRLSNAKKAITDLIGKIDNNDNIEADYSLVSFGTDDYLDKNWTENWEKTGDSYKEIIKAVNRLQPKGQNGDKDISGGTNYEAALKSAGIQMNNAPKSPEEDNPATKVVIFLTDGVPTCHDNEGTGVIGGSNQPNYDDYFGALKGAATITCHQFYAIGFEIPKKNGKYEKYSSIYGDTKFDKRCELKKVKVGKNEEYKWVLERTGEDILKDVAKEVNTPQESPGTVYMSDDATELNKKFEDITGKLTEFNCYNVTVTDDLSQYVEVNSIEGNPAALTVSYAQFDSDGKILKSTRKSETGTVDDTEGVTLALPEPTDRNPNGGTMTAKYIPDGSEHGRIVLEFSDGYRLEPRYKYYVTVQVRASQKAYDDAEKLPTTADGAKEYPNEGGIKTDHPDVYENYGDNEEQLKANLISDGKKGFYTNDGAIVTFTYGDGEKIGQLGKEVYPDPVIRVTPAKLTLKKTVKGLNSTETEELFKELSFIVDGNEKLVKLGENNYSFAEDNRRYTIFAEVEVTPGTHTVKEIWHTADVDGYVRETTYNTAVGSTTTGPITAEADKDGNLPATITLKPNQSGTINFTNKYTARTERLQLLKVDGDNKSDGFENLTFRVKKGTPAVSGNDPEVLDKAIEDLGEDVATLKIKDDGMANLTDISPDYEDYNELDKEDFVLPVGSYTVIEDRTGMDLNNYAEVYPFILQVNANGAVTVSDIGDFQNNGNVRISTATIPATEDTPETKYHVITVINRQMKLSELRLLKVSAQSMVPLKDAVFDLYKVTGEENGEIKGKELKKGLTTDADGLIKDDVLKNLDSGETYYLVETKAPDGYMLLKGKIFFKVSVKLETDGNEVVVTPSDNTSFIATLYKKEGDSEEKYVNYYEDLTEAERAGTKPYNFDKETDTKYWTLGINNNTGEELPVTGGPGTMAYTFGGLAMIIAVSLMYGLNMRRKREKGGMN